MITLFRLLAILCLSSSVSAFAVDCYRGGYRGTTLTSEDSPAFKTPKGTQPGQKIWGSGDINIAVYYGNALGWATDNPSKNIYAWIKLPQINNINMSNNPHLTFGIVHNDVDYEGINGRIDTHAYLDKYEQYYNGYYYDPVCNDSTLQKNVVFSAHFRVYVKFENRPAGDQTVNFGTVNVLRFDGKGGANMSSNAKSLRCVITGLDNISFLDCSVGVRIFPEGQIVNFGQIATNSITTYRPKAAFSVSTIKDIAADCTEQFDVATNFYTTGTLHDNTHLEMDNGLLMRITSRKTQGGIKFDQYKRFATYTPGQIGATVTRDCQAELSQKLGETLVYGPFKKDLVVKISYN